MQALAEKLPLLLVSASGRALAQSAARAGVPVVVLDLFNDLDARALAVGNIKYQTQRSLLETMLRAEKPLYLDMRDAFIEARKHAGVS